MPDNQHYPNFDPQLECCSVEVCREGSFVWLTIRSEQSVGKSIGLTPEEAREVSSLLTRSASATKRRVRDVPQAQA